MKNFKKYVAILLMMVSFGMCFPMKSYAIENIDSKVENRLNISYQDNGNSLNGAQFSLYFIASKDEYGNLSIMDDFSNYPVEILPEQDSDWYTLALTLESYILRDGLNPIDVGKTDEHGELSFPTATNQIKTGLYLVIGQSHTQEGYVYHAQPFLVMLPTANPSSSSWIYDVNVNPKFDKREELVDKTMSQTVLKIWHDEGYEKERPEMITIELLCDGKVYDTIQLSAQNQWRYTWNDLSTSSTWTVVEKEIGDYSVGIVKDGTTFVVTNTYTNGSADTTNSKLPQTGQLWWPIPLMFTIGLMFIVMGLLQQRGKKR